LRFPRNAASPSRKSAVVRLAADLQEALSDVDDALRRIADGTYGRCERCGNPISEARLEAMPAARRCLDCAKLP